MTGSIERLQEEFDIDITWTAFPLHPYIPMEGMSFEDLFSGRQIDIPQMQKRLETAANNAGLPYTGPQLACNSRLAQEMGKWAETQGKGDAFHLAVFKAYFVEEKNIGDPQILVEVAETLGLPADEAGEVIQNRTHREDVDQDWARSKEQFVTAVPTFLIGRQRL
ncbi:MAG: DsbA family protein, partial [Deltaproteobacteria bacterium]|nr:DsbA family protein [Deltaproteobacteria bacterium]